MAGYSGGVQFSSYKYSHTEDSDMKGIYRLHNTQQSPKPCKETKRMLDSLSSSMAMVLRLMKACEEG